MKEKEFKGESVYSFSAFLFILVTAIGCFIFLFLICYSLYSGRDESLIAAFIGCPIFVLTGVFFSMLLGCVGEIEINTRKANKAIEAISQKQQNVASFIAEPSQTNELCFMDWLLDSLKLSQYREAFRSAGVLEYNHFMKLSEEDLKKLRIEEKDIKSLLNTQIKMKVTR